jgi:ElaB/YqjD/DUF883 family membrane-anchored ribosome-binding protein
MARSPSETGVETRERPARDPAVARAEADLAGARERVAESMRALRDEVARKTDWRGWVQRNPGWALGAAFALGLLMGTRGRGRRPPKEIGGRSWT